MRNSDYDEQTFIKETNFQVLQLKRLAIGQWLVGSFTAFINKLCMPALIAVMSIYIPASVVVRFFLSAYKPTLPCISILLPILFQTKITMVYNAILKILRKEKQMMYISVFALVCCLASTACSALYAPSLKGIACATTFSCGIWYALSRYFITLGRYCGIYENYQY